MNFKRKFAVNFYKNLKLSLGEMSFYKDFINDTHGDPYPLISKKAATEEHLSHGHYFVDGDVQRLLGDYFPYATYEAKIESLNGKCGFSFVTPLGKAEILTRNDNGKLFLIFNGDEIATEYPFKEGMSLVVTSRRNCFEVCINLGDTPEFITEFCASQLEGIHFEKNFKNSHADIVVQGEAELSAVEFYMDCGISQADIRPVKYENGEIMFEAGKMFLTLSARMQKETYQAVFSWTPGTCDFELVGAIFFDVGDWAWCSDVATSLKFNRLNGKWDLWVCSFSHDHILGYAEFDGDVRFGVNVVDITLMPTAEEDDDHTEFLGFTGDEDPDFIYDEKSGKWFFTVCRLVKNGTGSTYAYHLFEGDSPFKCDKFISSSAGGAETGGSLVYLDDQLYFVCGNGYNIRASYRMYKVPNLEEYTKLKFDYDDGGFRGWGTIIPLKYGSRERIFLLTFDRHNASSYNWSYGNLYCFEAYKD